jgi:hypothetical protein
VSLLLRTPSGYRDSRLHIEYSQPGSSHGPDDFSKEGTVMRIGEFIRTHPDDIEPAWEAFAKSISSFAPDLSVWSLRDHLREILLAMADDMESPQSPDEQAERVKAKRFVATRSIG